MKLSCIRFLLTLGLALLRTAQACDVHDHARRADADHRRLGTETAIDQLFSSTRSREDRDHTRCGARELTADEKSEGVRIVRDWKERRRLETRRLQETIEIPVYFYNIVDVVGTGSVTVRQIEDQMEVLNDAYHPHFSFTLVESQQIVDTDWYLCEYESTKTDTMKHELRQGGADALHIFTCDPHDGKLGWAAFPEDLRRRGQYDGVILNHETLPGGRASPYNRGMTATHEIGHWLGLLHTFEGGCNDEDGVDDTPPEQGPTYGCPNSFVDTCTDSPGWDSVRNYMNFANDACMEFFTNGQVERMLAMWDEYRAGGGDSDGRGGRPETNAGEPTPGPSPGPTHQPIEPPTDTPTILESENSGEEAESQCLEASEECEDSDECCSSNCRRGSCMDTGGGSGVRGGGDSRNSGSDSDSSTGSRGGSPGSTDGTRSRGGFGGSRSGSDPSTPDTESSTEPSSGGTGSRLQKRRGG